MKLRLLLPLLLLVTLPVAQAGTIGPALQAEIEASAGAAELAVIVRFDAALDLADWRKEYAQQLRALYPDPQERKLHRKALKRQLLLRRMQERAAVTGQGTAQWLAQQGLAKGRELWVINGMAVRVPAGLVAELAALPGVSSVVSDAVVQGPGPGSAPTSPTYWNLDAIGASALWDLGYTGTGVVVATLDSGVDASHPDLGPRYRGGANSWFDPYGQNPAPADATGHGSQVMGIILAGDAGGYQVGVAPDAEWIAAKIFDNANQATLSGIHAGLQWVLDPDGDPATDDAPGIVNNSWALATTVGECNREFAADIALLREAEIAVTFSGGNFGPKADTSVAPANDTGSLAVGAVDERLRISRSSSRGPGACDGGIYPQLVGPGDNILTTDAMPGFYNVVSGTSFSVAHVSGAMALLAGAFPDATVSQLETALQGTAVDLGDSGPDTSFGFGLIDVGAAYDWLLANGTGGGPGGNPGELSLSANAYAVDENIAALTVTVTRSNGTDGDVTVDYATADGTATAGQDYVATTGTLTLLDGEATGSFAVTLLDDADYEGDESFTVALANAGGGAQLAQPDTASVAIRDDETPPGPADADGDGFDATLDCDDGNASIYPGAAEIARDGIDQDCNGYDLTIEITRATFNNDQATVWATSDLGSQANLKVTFILADGGTAASSMAWKSKKGRWETAIKRFTHSYGSTPVSVTVSGTEGSISAAM